MQRFKLNIAAFVIAFIYFTVMQLQSCRHDPVGIDELDTVCFTRDVVPILMSQCAECHSPNGSKSDILIDSIYENVLQLVTPGNIAKSKLYTIVSSPNNPNMMPPNRALTSNQLHILEVWIAQGAHNKVCLKDAVALPPIAPISSVDGAVLYSTYCEGCHGPLSTSTKRGASGLMLNKGIDSVSLMKSLKLLSDAQRQAIVSVLVGSPFTTLNGAVLYASYCKSCHGPLATSAKLNATVSDINNGINTIPDMKNLSVLTDAQRKAIADSLVGTPISTLDGALLYATYCAGCHGPLATSSKIGALLNQLLAGVNNVPEMKNLSQLSDPQKQAIITALAGTPNPNPDGKELYTNTCAKCHGPFANSNVGGKPVSEITQAIGEVTQMKYLSSLTAIQIKAIANALKSIPEND